MNRYLDLHLSQAQLSLSRAANNHYSDKSKEVYQSKLQELFELILSNFNSAQPTTEAEIIEIKRELDFIFKSLEFLESSTLNLIPFELVECLKYAMNDWLRPGDKYIITTSLINTINNFSFDRTYLAGNPIFTSLDAKYNIQFPEKLVSINFPKATARDYLISVVLYHELGHFIDNTYNITRALANDLFNKYFANNLLSDEIVDVEKYFPFLKSIDKSKPFNGLYVLQVLTAHLAEYFCDLFASQYIGECSSNYLEYITVEYKTIASDGHPSTNLRVNIVEEFINGKGSYLLELICEGTRSTTNGIELKKRFEELKSDDFYNFLPIDIVNTDQLHGLYKLGWSIWKGDWKQFEINMGLSKPLERDKIYSIINNLIEKSIGNFIIANKWKKGI